MTDITSAPATPDSGAETVRNIISIDVEEYFHPTEVQGAAPEHQWGHLPSRADEQTRQILDLFAEKNVRGTFFILGWVAERHPRLIRDIAVRGHEIACHSYSHRLVYDLTPHQFRADTIRAVSVIEDTAGVTPRAYRAPSYSITRESLWALEILVECGFTHDSSIYPISHDRYGIRGFERHAHILETPSGSIREVPIATVKLPGGRIAPIGGGGYLRLLPYRYTAAGIRRTNRLERQPACIYFHPWEIDPDQPRLASGSIARMRTYTGLRSMGRKIKRMLSEFYFAPVAELHPQMIRPGAAFSSKAVT